MVMNFPPYNADIAKIIASSQDPVRYATLALAINQILKNNIKGKINDLVFFSKENGIFEFFIDDGYGNIKNGVSIIKNGNSISANTLNIYKRSKELFFDGNVRAIYEK